MFYKKKGKYYELKNHWMMPQLISINENETKRDDLKFDTPMVYLSSKIETVDGDNEYIGMDNMSFPNPFKDGQPTFGWFKAYPGKKIDFVNPFIIQSFENFRQWMKNGLTSSSFIVNIEAGRLELADPSKIAIDSENVIWSDERFFYLDGKVVKLQFQGNLIKEINLNDTTPKFKYYISPIFDFYIIDKIKVRQIGENRSNDAARIRMITSNKRANFSKILGQKWEGNYDPTDYSKEFSVSPADFYNEIGGGKKGGIICPTAMMGANCVASKEYTEQLFQMPIHTATDLVFEIDNLENPGVFTDLSYELIFEISFYKYMD